MESSLTATVHGRVREVLVVRQRARARGQAAAADRPDRGRGGRRARRASACASSRPSSTRAGAASASRWLVLGYDVTPDEVERALARGPGARATPTRSAGCSSSTPTCARSTGRTPTASTSELGSPQEHLHAFLRSLDAEAEGLPDRFVAHLERALAHYGVDGLERTAALEDAAYRLFLAHQRAGTAREAVRGILAAPARARRAARRRLPRGARPPRGGARPARARARRAGARGALALLRRARARGRARGDLRGDGAATSPRSATPDGPAEREAHVDALVDCPQPLAPLLAACRATPARSWRR